MITPGRAVETIDRALRKSRSLDRHAGIRHAVRMPSTAAAPARATVVQNPVADYSSWPTQTEAAAQLATNERTIRRWIGSGRLRGAFRPAVGRKPIAIVDPAGVERLRTERRQVVVVEHVAPEPSDSDARRAVGPHLPEQGAAFQHFLASILQAYPVRHPKSWLTLDEAAEASGLPKAWLLAQARLGEASAKCVMAINVGSERRVLWRFNREALKK
jgi:hypothetical protein